MKTSLKTRLQTYLQRHGGWFASGDLEQLAIRHGYTGSTATRSLRKLVEEEVLDVEYRGKTRHAFYKAKDYKPVQRGYLDEKRGIYVVTNR